MNEAIVEFKSAFARYEGLWAPADRMEEILHIVRIAIRHVAVLYGCETWRTCLESKLRVLVRVVSERKRAFSFALRYSLARAFLEVVQVYHFEPLRVMPMLSNRAVPRRA